MFVKPYNNGVLFTGVTLAGENAKHTWDSPKDEDGEPTQSQRLVIKNLLLGHEAKANEYTVVEAEAPGMDGKVVKIPIAVLKAGETRSMNPHLEFPDGPVTFKLINGTGPVYLHGLLGAGSNEELDLEEAELEEVYPEEDVSVGILYGNIEHYLLTKSLLLPGGRSRG